MKFLFEVTTKSYKRYYVLADGYDDAKKKVDEEIFKNHNESILDGDGSLKLNIDEVESIKCLGDKLLKT